MANALGIEATDITYQKYCDLHNLGTTRHNKGHLEVERNTIGEHDDILECNLTTQTSHEVIPIQQKEDYKLNF